MKHLLNNISEEEKNRIREQHEGGMNLAIDNFKKLVETKSGDAKPFISESSKETCEQCGGMLKEGECVEQCGSMKEEELDEQNAETLPSRKGIKLGPLNDNDIRELVKQIGLGFKQDLKTKVGNYGKNQATALECMLSAKWK